MVDSLAMSYISYLSDSTISLIHNYAYLGNSLSKPNTVKYFDVADESITGTEVKYDTIGDRKNGTVRVCVLSDTHDRHHLFENLPPCDIFIHCGDIGMSGRFYSDETLKSRLKRFNDWIGGIPATHKIVVGGNHDRLLELLTPEEAQEILSQAVYLCNSHTEVMGLRIFGSPLSHGTSGNNAFQSLEFEEDFKDKVSKSGTDAVDIDILITHGPCHHLGAAVRPRLAHINGHLHNLHGVKRVQLSASVHDLTDVGIDHSSSSGAGSWLRIAAPIMNARYQPKQLPIVVDLPVLK
jgi:hypothetical protein